MWQFSWKSEKKIFDPFFKTFFTNRGKNGDEDEKYGEMISIFEFSISKLKYGVVFMKILEKFF